MANARYAEAETCFMNALKLAPNYSYLHTNMGILKSAMNSPKEAEHYFQNALSLGGHLPEPHFYYAQFLHQQNQDTRAILELVKTLELSPGHALADSLLKSLSSTPENLLNLSLAYYTIGKYRESIQASEQALRLRPTYDLAYNNLCSAYNQLGEWDLAIEAGEKAVKLNPTNQLAKNNLAWAKSQKAKRN
jgi:tetratricopeptide (TPR) repeat protein